MLYLIGQDIKCNAGSKGVARNGHAPLEVRVTLAEEIKKAVHLTHYLIDDGLCGKHRRSTQASRVKGTMEGAEHFHVLFKGHAQQ